VKQEKKGFEVAKLFIFFKYVAFAVFTLVSGYISVNMFTGLTEEIIGRSVLIATAVSIEILKIFLLIKANTLLKAFLKWEAFRNYALYALTVSLSILASFGFNLTLINRSVENLSAVNSETYIELQGELANKELLLTEKQGLENQIVVFQNRLAEIPEDFSTAYRETSDRIQRFYDQVATKNSEIADVTLDITRLETLLAQERADLKSTANMFELMAEAFVSFPIINSDNNIRMILLLIIALLIESGIILTSPSIPIDPEHIEHFLGGDLSIAQLSKVQEHLLQATKKMNEIKHKEEEFLHAEESPPPDNMREDYSEQFAKVKERIETERAIQPFLKALEAEKESEARLQEHYDVVEKQKSEIAPLTTEPHLALQKLSLEDDQEPIPAEEVFKSIERGLQEAIEASPVEIVNEDKIKNIDYNVDLPSEDMQTFMKVEEPEATPITEEVIDQLDAPHGDEPIVPEFDYPQKIIDDATKLHQVKQELIKEEQAPKDLEEVENEPPKKIRQKKTKVRPKKEEKKEEKVEEVKEEPKKQEVPVRPPKQTIAPKLPKRPQGLKTYRIGKITEKVKEQFIAFTEALFPPKGRKLLPLEIAIKNSGVTDHIGQEFFRRLRLLKGPGNTPLIEELKKGEFVAHFTKQYIIEYATVETVEQSYKLTTRR
jgi:hypothetical protein